MLEFARRFAGALAYQTWSLLPVLGLLFLAAGFRGFRRSLPLRFARAGQGSLRVDRAEHGCYTELTYQLEPGNAPRQSVPISAALCDALAGKGLQTVPIHYVKWGPFKGRVFLDGEPPVDDSPLPRDRFHLLVIFGVLILFPAVVQAGSPNAQAFVDKEKAREANAGFPWRLW